MRQYLQSGKGGNIKHRKRKFISSKLSQKQGDDIKQLERQKWKSQYHRKKENCKVEDMDKIVGMKL